MEEIGLKEELNRLRQELNMYQNIFNLMHTTLRLDEILYIILTAVTAHVGLGFNRAILFLVNDKEKIIEGKMGIGPASGEEANRIWTNIEKEKPTLEDLVSIHRQYSIVESSQFNKLVKNIKIPLDKDKGGILTSTIYNGTCIHFSKKESALKQNDHLFQFIESNEFVSVPLKGDDKTIGAIVIDNLFTQEPITDNDIRMLSLFSEQAGLAIEKSQLYEKTLLKSHTDSLTGLFNHGYFQSKLEELLVNTKTENCPLSLIMLDIDNFKNSNDSLGHQAGDKILIELAEVIKISLRKCDIACRYGGEEFSIILPNTNKDETFFIAERIRQNIENHTFLAGKYNLNLTASIGIATFPIDAQDKSNLITCADQTCLNAKKNGKNKTDIFP